MNIRDPPPQQKTAPQKAIALLILIVSIQGLATQKIKNLSSPDTHFLTRPTDSLEAKF